MKLPYGFQHADDSRLEIPLESDFGILPADPGLLGATERDIGGSRAVMIHPRRADFEARGDSAARSGSALHTEPLNP